MLLPKKLLRSRYSVFSFFLCISTIRADISLNDILHSDYNYLHPPKTNVSDEPVGVNISISKISLRSIDESDMSFSVALEMYQIWIDHRLHYPSWATGNFSIMDSRWIDKLWNPKLYFLNSVDGKMDNIITPSNFFWLRKDGRMIYCCRVILKLICEMDLKRFPHDEQECHIKMGSSTFTTTDVVLHWSPTKRETQIFSLQQFEVKQFKRERFEREWGDSGLSCLQLTVVLQRRTGYYLINVYIPTVLIVIASMLTFWIPPDAVPARVTLGVASLLTMITKQYQASMPAVSYIVALNIWLSSCIAFVFFSLMECAVVVALSSSGIKQDKGHFHLTDKMIPMVMLRSNGTWSMKDNWSSRKPTYKKAKENLAPRRLDRFSRVFFPLAFIVFVITYFIFYDSRSDYD